MRPIPALWLICLILAASCSSGSRNSVAEIGPGGNLKALENNLNVNLEAGNEKGVIHLNSTITITFDEPVDPSTLTPDSFSVAHTSGMPVPGRLVAKDNEVHFFPEIKIVNGQVHYPWGEIETKFRFFLPKGGLRAIGGGVAEGDLGCELSLQRTVVDLDGLAPSISLQSPDQLKPADPDTMVLVEFSEFMQPVALLAGASGSIMARRGLSGWIELVMPRRIVFDQITRRTQLIFSANRLLPAGAEMKVSFNALACDLAGNPVVPTELFFRIKSYQGPDLVIEEEFLNDAMQDKGATGLDWARNAKSGLRPGRLGGTGALGEFIAPPGETVISTEDSVWSGDTTLTGSQIRVTNGVFFFQRFEVPINSVVRFKGSYPVQLFVAGDFVVKGKLLCDGFASPAHDGGAFQPRGGLGGDGGPGGGNGGRGGGQPMFSQVLGFSGNPVKMPAGHPKGSFNLGTGGQGGPGNPASGATKDILFDAAQISHMIAAGGGGGGFLAAGMGGRVEIIPQANPLNAGKASVGGKAFPLLPLVPLLPSHIQFLLGGSGGGGGGSHPYLSKNSFFGNVDWHSAGGGGGGGGALIARVGGQVLFAAASMVSAQGGDSANDNTSFATPGGGGSGGSLLFQCAQPPIMGGTVSVLGGKAGVLTETNQASKVLGGNGSNGFYRVEAEPIPSISLMHGFWPAPVSANAGLLEEKDPISAGRSRCYFAQTFLPEYTHYEMRVKEGTNLVTYSDDPTKGLIPMAGFSPAVIFFQGAVLGFDSQPKSYLPWTGSVKTMGPLGAGALSSYRWVIRLDRSLLPPGADLEVVSLKVFYRP